MKEEMITISNGVDSVIGLIKTAFINKNDEVIIREIIFPVFERIIRIIGGKKFL